MHYRSAMQALLAAVRQACSPAVWSRGVELSRSGSVLGERVNGEEIELKVSTQGGMICPTVTLFPKDLDWTCDCPSRDDACVHVAAAVIALNRARQEGKLMPESTKPTARLQYRFNRTPSGLALERYLVHAGEARPLGMTLAALAANAGRGGPAFVASSADLATELVLSNRPHGVIARPLMVRLLAAMQDCPDVQLDGKPIKIGEAQPVIIAQLTARPPGHLLTVRQDPTITTVFANGAVLAGDTLRAIGDNPLSARELEDLRQGRYYSPDALATLVTEVLPALRRRLPVDSRGVDLPEARKTPPRIILQTTPIPAPDASAGPSIDGFSVLPIMVYGDPPVARIDLGQLRHLGGTVPLRDGMAENRLTRKLGDDLGLELGQRKVVRGAAAVAMAERLRTWSGKIEGTGQDTFFLAPPLVPRLVTKDGQMSVVFESGAAFGSTPAGHADAAAVLTAWRQSDSLVRLLEGGWAPLPAGWLDKYGARVADLLNARNEDGTLAQHAAPTLLKLCEDLNCPPPANLAPLAALLGDFTGIPTATLPPDLTAQLRDYQKRGVNWLAFLRDAGLGAMLADDMGLGKTLQALCCVRGRTLVVAPTSVLFNWQEEAKRFRRGLRVSLYHGPNRRLDPSADLTITTYAILRLDAPELAAEAWDTVILDEAQTIKNPDSQVAQAAYGLRAAFRLTLTGTPVENRLDELWSQFHFLNRGLLGGRQDFQERYGKPIAEGRPGAAALLHERVRPFLLRRLKRDVAPELPPRTDVVLRCTLGPDERSIYDAIRAATMKDVVERLQAGGSVLAALEALLRLRQACCHASLVPGQRVETSAKTELLLETLEETLAEGHKALVFSQWTGLLDLIEPRLRAAGVRFNRLDGSTADRGAVVREFQDDAGPPVMLVSLKAGGTGLNLTAADHVFLLDPWWNPAVEDQAADRAHRIGQTRPVFVHRLVAQDTVEERILALQEEKRAVAQAALEGSDRGASLTRDDLLALLG